MRSRLSIFAVYLAAGWGVGLFIALLAVASSVNDQGGQIARLQARLTHDEQAHAHVTAAACPPGMTCLSNVSITDNNGLGDALQVHDGMGNPMMGVDIFQLYSSNPVCSIASSADPKVNLQPRACLGGVPPLNATGGYPVVALWDGTRWQVLTARDIVWLHRAERIRPRW